MMKATAKKRNIATSLSVLIIASSIQSGCSGGPKFEADCNYSDPFNQDWPTGNNYIGIDCEKSNCCALDESGKATCWGDYIESPKGVFRNISVGYENACGVETTGKITCWEYYNDEPFSLDTDFVDVSAGWYNHTCGLHESGAIECWGCDTEHDFGKCDAPSDTDFTSVSAGGDFTCGLHQNGSIDCWGDNSHGECNAPPGNDFVTVNAYDISSCGLHKNGTIECWGECGEEEDEDICDGPDDSDFVAASTGQKGWGIHKDGSLECWVCEEGEDELPSGTGFVAVSIGLSFICALHKDGWIVCWGDQPGCAYVY